jgi:predicted esterase
MALSKNAKVGLGVTVAGLALALILAVTSGGASAAQVPNIEPSKPPKPEPQPQPALSNFAGMQGRLFEVNVPPNKIAPLVVALHGRDADEQQLEQLLREGKINAHVLLLRGSLKGVKGFRYFDPFFTDSNVLLAPAISAATDQVAAAILDAENKLKTLGVYVGTTIIGYDQGAAITYALATREIGGAMNSNYMMIAGMLPPSLYPSADDPKRWDNVSLVAVHGSDDTVIPLKEAQATLAAFMGKGLMSPPPPNGDGGARPKAASFVVAGGTHELSTLRATVQAIIND